MRSKNYLFLFIFSFFSFAFKKSSQELSSEKFVEGEYLIVLDKKPVSSSSAFEIQSVQKKLENFAYKIQQIEGEILGTFSHAFVGLHVKLKPGSVSFLEDDSEVKFIEKNGRAFLDEGNSSSLRSWGLDRIDQIDLPLDDLYISPFTFTGKSAHAYVVDTGIRETHEDFHGRIGAGYSAMGDDSSPYEDCNGHGTHVAGTVGGTSSGVAKGVTLHAVRVFGCSGSTTWAIILNGLEWIAENHESPAVANMSLGGSYSEALNEAVANLTEAGVHMVVSAGNDYAGDACSKSPASEASAITVAASDSSDKMAYFSNVGKCVDITAPGVDIKSASNQGDSDYRSLSGTSMSAPHVTGAAALFLEAFPDLTPEELERHLLKQGNKGKIIDPKGSPNVLLYVSTYGMLPLVSAGDDIIVRYPDSDVTLVGKAQSSSAVGPVTIGRWNQIWGPSSLGESIESIFYEGSYSWEQTLKMKQLPVGKYGFRYVVRNEKGYIALPVVFSS